MNVLNVLLQIIYIHNSLVSNCAGRGMVILDDMIQKDFVFCEVYGTDWILRVMVVWESSPWKLTRVCLGKFCMSTLWQIFYKEWYYESSCKEGSQVIHNTTFSMLIFIMLPFSVPCCRTCRTQCTLYSCVLSFSITLLRNFPWCNSIVSENLTFSSKDHYFFPRRGSPKMVKFCIWS